MRFRRLGPVLSALLGVLLGAAGLRAQTPTGTVAGRVLEAGTQTPLAGASVTIASTTRGVVTGADGTFRITGVPAGAQTVRASMIGRTTSEQSVTVIAGETATVAFSLASSTLQMEQVVVVGYGTQRRSDVTGAVSSVSVEQLQRTAVTSVQQGLQGTVAGVQVTQGDATPGGGISVQIRGVNSPNGDNQPLYVIDGVPVASTTASKSTDQLGGSEAALSTTNPLSTLAPADIESIEVLKDASATAIYGSRGANGVVIITTKRGRPGQPGQISVNYSEGMSQVIRDIDVLDARGYAEYVNRSYINAGRYLGRTDSITPYGGRQGSLTPDQLVERYGNGIDWQDRIFQTAAVHDLQVGFTGGDDRGNYAVTGNYLDQGGPIRGSGFRRGGMRVNLDRELNSTFRLSSNVAVTRSANELVRASTVEGTTSMGIVRGAIRYSPLANEAFDTLQLQNNPNSMVEDPAYFRRFGANPVRYATEVTENEGITRGLGGLRLSAALPRGFSLESSLGGNYEDKDVSSYYPRTVYEGNANRGLAVVAGSEFVNLVNDNLLRYRNDFGGGEHRIDAVGGFSYEWSRSRWMRTQATNFPDDDIRGDNVLQRATQVAIPRSGVDTWELASWLGRVNYNFRDRYLLTGTVRSDGSSKFATNNKWATFYSLAAGWRIKGEPFLRDLETVNDLKLRASIGQSGNQGIGPYQSLASVNGGEPVVIGEVLIPSAFIDRLANDDLRWETTTQFDVGFDLTAFDSRFTLTADYYHKSTTDLLQQVTLAASTGFTTATFNSGEVTNRGVEVQAGFDVLTGDAGRLRWNVSGNFARNVNRIESLGPISQQFADRLGAGGGLEVNPFIQKPGLPIGAIWGYRTDGIYRTQGEVDTDFQADARFGDYRYEDVNGDGVLDQDDRTLIGDVNPDFIWGLTNRFEIGRFDLSALIQGSVGGDVVNSQRLTYLTLNGTSGNVPEEFVKNAFDPETNPDGEYPMVSVDRGGYTRFSDAFIEDASYVRLKNLQLGYAIPLRRYVSSARLYVNAINLLTFTDYTGFDPEVSAFGSTAMRGVDLGSYPQSRMISVGMNVGF